MSSSSRLGVVVLLVLIGALLGQMVCLFAGSRVAAGLGRGALKTGDRIAGAAAGAFGVLFSMWLLLPMAADVPGWTSQQVRNSGIAQAIYNNAPRPPDAIQTLERLVGSANFPRVFNGIEASPDSGPAPASVTLSGDVINRVRSSTVKVEGEACHRTQDGSGFAVGNGLIATNAHVVAGERRTTVLTPAGQELAATVVAYDPARDLALLRVPKYTGIPLAVGSASIGETGAVFGHPNGQDAVDIQPAAVRRQIVAVGRDLYDKQTTHRDVLILASTLQPGDSGGALVDAKGEVIGVAFAIAPDKAGTAYALSTNELRAVLNQPRSGEPVPTGACVNE